MERPIPAPRRLKRSQHKPPVPERSFILSGGDRDGYESASNAVRLPSSTTIVADSLGDPSTSAGIDSVSPCSQGSLSTESLHRSPKSISSAPQTSPKPPKRITSCSSSPTSAQANSTDSVGMKKTELLNPLVSSSLVHRTPETRRGSPPPVPARNKNLSLLSREVAATHPLQNHIGADSQKSSEPTFGMLVEVDNGFSTKETSAAENDTECNSQNDDFVEPYTRPSSLCVDVKNLIDLDPLIPVTGVSNEVKNSANKEAGLDILCGYDGCNEQPSDCVASPDLSHMETRKDSDPTLCYDILRNSFEDGFWNPRYMGLDEYRKLVEATDNSASEVFSKKCSVQTSFESADDDSSSTALDIATNSVDRELEQDSSVAEGRSICFSGLVHLILHKKDRGKVWGVLRDSKLSFFRNEDEDENVLLGPFDLKNTVYVGRNSKKTDEVDLCIRENSISVHWDHLTLVTDSPQHWVFLIVQCFMPKHDILSQEENIDAGGIVYIRQGATCPWSEGWMHVDSEQRRLLYTLDRKVEVFALDIRKLIAMKSDVVKVDWCASVAGSQKGPFMLTWEGCSLYIQADNDTITGLWADKLSSEMEKSSNKLEDFKLTKHDVPVLVERCINFIWAFGLSQPGLYRRNGSTIEARLLMEELKKDPANVQIPPNGEDMVNVVADVLRSFFRQLESPLIPKSIHEQLFTISKIKDNDRLKKYHELLVTLPRVRLETLRRLLGHLREVSENADSNSATIENLASVFGPTLFTVEDENTNCGELNRTVQQMVVVKDLLENYKVIFQESINEMRAKSKMLGKTNPPKARAEGLLVAIHLRERDSFTFNVQSSLTAEEVSEEARNRPSFTNEGSGAHFALFEVIKSGQLERRVGLKEKMSSMVAGRWIDWESSGDCYLIFKPDLLPFTNSLSAFADKVKIAGPGSKSFSACHLKLDSSNASVIQCNKSLKQVNAWHVDDLLWFNGHETARKPPYDYTLTFLVLKKGFKYKSKLIGYCLAFENNAGRLNWLNAVLSAQRDFQPSPLYASVI